MKLQVGRVLKKLIAEGRISNPSSAKGRLMAEAAKLFSEKGYSSTTVREIATEVGILSGSIFHHFKNKEDILFAIMNDIVQAMDEALLQTLNDANTIEEKIKALIHCELEFIHGKTSNAATVLLYEWKQLNKEYQQQVLKGRSYYFNLWQQTLTEAQEKQLTDIEPEYLRQLIHGAMVWTVHWYNPKGKLSKQELTERIYKLIIKP